jgi:hypothetical protein
MSNKSDGESDQKTTSGAADGPDLAAALPSGIAEKDFRRAVSTSGYPLQISVAAVFKQRDFYLQEEFAFEDPEEGGRRTLDVLGESWSERFKSSRGTSEFGTTALVECKQSRHPLVLFEAVSPPDLRGFPRMIGYPGQDVSVKTDPESRSARLVPVMEFLGSMDEAFISKPPVAASMSRAVGNGSKVKLSGEEIYRAITMPLIKAASAVRKYWTKPRANSNELWELRMMFPIAVVDCPLIFVGQPASAPTVEPQAWVRLAVRDMMSGQHDPWKPLGAQIIDVVQREFLETYLDSYLLPFTSTIRDRAYEIHDQFLNGSVTIEGLDWSAPPEEPLYRLVS